MSNLIFFYLSYVKHVLYESFVGYKDCMYFLPIYRLPFYPRCFLHGEQTFQ